jgi:hypothetical protein
MICNIIDYNKYLNILPKVLFDIVVAYYNVCPLKQMLYRSPITNPYHTHIIVIDDNVYKYYEYYDTRTYVKIFDNSYPNKYVIHELYHCDIKTHVISFKYNLTINNTYIDSNHCYIKTHGNHSIYFHNKPVQDFFPKIHHSMCIRWFYIDNDTLFLLNNERKLFNFNLRTRLLHYNMYVPRGYVGDLYICMPFVYIVDRRGNKIYNIADMTSFEIAHNIDHIY